MFEEPDFAEIRTRIETLEKPEHRLGLMFEYLAAARASEVSGKWAYLAERTDINEYEGEEVVVFQVQTAKRGGKLRPVALPLDPKYEPWARPLYMYMIRKEAGKAFNYSYKTLYRAAAKAFEGLNYQIEQYIIREELSLEGHKTLVPTHWRDLATHGLRHLRAKELVNTFNFNGQQLATYCGWSLSSVMGGSRIADRYVNLQWRDYFPKLLRKSQ